MARGALRRRLASSKATGRASSPRAMLGGCSTTRFVSVMSYFARRMAWMRAKRDCWIVRYMLWGSPRSEFGFRKITSVYQRVSCRTGRLRGGRPLRGGGGLLWGWGGRWVPPGSAGGVFFVELWGGLWF